MNSTFGPEYAGAYDSLYRDKDYEAECALIRRIFEQYSAQTPVRCVLDLGCGSGNHLVPLARGGFRMTGVDRSAAMLEKARRKLAEQALHADLACADIRAWRGGENFDAALMMFAVLGYQLEDDDVAAALRNARMLLRPGGLLLFDVWYGPAVLSQTPENRVKHVETTDSRIIRSSTGRLDSARQTCRVDFRVRLERNHEPPVQFEETHDVRFFSRGELETFLNDAGFRLLRLGAFPDFERDPGPDTWNVLAVAARFE